ncbi:MAG: sigma E protease regulator RseP [Aeromonadaceae bacterium]
MTMLLWNLCSFILALAILIAVHEWGHFWVARKCGVRVERFSLGFGKVLWSRKDKQGTEFSLSLIPLGGYVKMLDERVDEVPEALRSQAFNNKPVAQRFAIVAAGPIANFVFALLAFWVMFIIGVPTVKPVIGEVIPHTAAADAGLQPGMEILSINHKRTGDWESVTYALVSQLGNDEVELEVLNQGQMLRKRLSLVGWQLSNDDETLPFAPLGFRPLAPEVTLEVAEVIKGGSAARAGIQAGDKLVAAEEEPLADWLDFVTLVQASPLHPLHVTIERDGVRKDLMLTPDKRQLKDHDVGYVGIAPKVIPLDDRYRIELRYGPLDALWMGLEKTGSTITLTLEMLSKLITGIVSLDNLSGPISIAKGAGSTASFGLVYFLGFLALVSVNLGIINLFPLPVLDGGHLLFFVIEAVTGKPVPERIQEYAFKFGAAILVCLMGIALFNDFARL